MPSTQVPDVDRHYKYVSGESVRRDIDGTENGNLVRHMANVADGQVTMYAGRS